jgi:hypothetical protein
VFGTVEVVELGSGAGARGSLTAEVTVNWVSGAKSRRLGAGRAEAALLERDAGRIFNAGSGRVVVELRASTDRQTQATREIWSLVTAQAQQAAGWVYWMAGSLRIASLPVIQIACSFHLRVLRCPCLCRCRSPSSCWSLAIGATSAVPLCCSTPKRPRQIPHRDPDSPSSLLSHAPLQQVFHSIFRRHLARSVQI